MKWRNVAAFALLAFAATACSSDDEEPIDFDPTVNLNYTFSEDAEGWTGSFADYPEDDADFYELSFEHATLPDPLDNSDGALKQSGNNHSDDLFMYVKKKVTGLKPNTEYKVAFDIEIASNATGDSFGVGGSPATSVYVKAGISTIEPIGERQEDGHLRMNIDKSNQSNSGADMKKIGDFSNGTSGNDYALKTLTYSENELKARTNNDGELWLIVGTDSGFESTTTIYYNTIEADLTMIE